MDIKLKYILDKNKKRLYGTVNAYFDIKNFLAAFFLTNIFSLFVSASKIENFFISIIIFLSIYCFVLILGKLLFNGKKNYIFIPLILQYLRVGYFIMGLFLATFQYTYGIFIKGLGFDSSGKYFSDHFSDYYIFHNIHVFLAYFGINLLLILILYSIRRFRNYPLKFINKEQKIVYVSELMMFYSNFKENELNTYIDKDLNNLKHYQELKQKSKQKKSVNLDNYIKIIFIFTLLILFFPLIFMHMTIQKFALYVVGFFLFAGGMVFNFLYSSQIAVNILSLFIYMKKNKLHLTNEWAYIEQEYIKRYENGEFKNVRIPTKMRKKYSKKKKENNKKDLE